MVLMVFSWAVRGTVVRMVEWSSGGLHRLAQIVRIRDLRSWFVGFSRIEGHPVRLPPGSRKSNVRL
jgi:hypothetical protein